MAAEEHPVLPDIQDVAPLVTRILGQNPSPYTLQGTNTYLLRAREPATAILLDAGQDFDGYIPLLHKAFADKGYKTLSDIIITHYHHDHVLGLKSILKWVEEEKMPVPRIHKFPCVDNGDHDRVMLDILKEHEPYLKHSFELLEDGQIFPLAGDAKLRVLSTPGHTEDSSSYTLEGTDTPLMFTADTVLGRGTAVFVDLKALVESLQRMIEETEKIKIGNGHVKLLCGHGPVIDDGAAKMKEYIEHRMDRERQIVDVLRQAGKQQTAAELVKTIYGPQLPEQVVPAAQNGVILHLLKLESEGKVKKTPGDSADGKEDNTSALWQISLAKV